MRCINVYPIVVSHILIHHSFMQLFAIFSLLKLLYLRKDMNLSNFQLDVNPHKDLIVKPFSTWDLLRISSHITSSSFKTWHHSPAVEEEKMIIRSSEIPWNFLQTHVLSSIQLQLRCPVYAASPITWIRWCSDFLPHLYDESPGWHMWYVTLFVRWHRAMEFQTYCLSITFLLNS